LVLTDDSPCVSACCTRFRTETRAVGYIVFRKIADIENFVTMIVRHWYFCRRDHEIIAVCHLEHIIFKLGKLACARKAGTIDHQRRQHLGISVLLTVQIHHKLNKCPFETSTESLVKYKSRARYLAGAFKIENIQFTCDIPMGQRFKIKLRLLPPYANFPVLILRFTNRYRIMGNIRYSKQDLLKLFFQIPDF